MTDQVALDLGEQRGERGHDLGLNVALALDADVLLQGHEGDSRLGEGVEDGDDLPQRSAEPGEFTDDQAVAGLQGARQFVQPPTLLGSLPGGGRLDEVVDVEVVLFARTPGWRGAGCSRPAAGSRPADRRRSSRPCPWNAASGSLSDRCGAWNALLFPATEVLDQNDPLFLIESCRSPTPTSPAPA